MSNSTKVGSLGKIGDARLDLVPDLSECAPGIKPVEYNVVIAPAKAPDKIGALFVPDDYKDNAGLAMQVGRIVRMSPLAFSYDKWPDDADKPAVGQIVWFARYAGKEFEGADGKTYRILKDKDIGAVIETPAAVADPLPIDRLTEAEAFSIFGASARPSMPKPFELDSFPLKETANG